jgi:hypothetical protein
MRHVLGRPRGLGDGFAPVRLRHRLRGSQIRRALTHVVDGKAMSVPLPKLLTEMTVRVPLELRQRSCPRIPLPACGERSTRTSSCVSGEGAINGLRESRVPLTPTLSVEVGCFRLRPLMMTELGQARVRLQAGRGSPGPSRGNVVHQFHRDALLVLVIWRSCRSIPPIRRLQKPTRARSRPPRALGVAVHVRNGVVRPTGSLRRRRPLAPATAEVT